MISLVRFRSTLLAATLLVCACSEGPQEPEDQLPADVSLTAQTANALVYAAFSVQAQVSTSDGAGLNGVPLTWSAWLEAQCVGVRPPENCNLQTAKLEPAISTTDASGAATTSLVAMTAGTYRIVASTPDGVSDTLSILVTSPANAGQEFTWTELPDMPRPRHGATAAVFAGRIYVIGGYCTYYQVNCGFDQRGAFVLIFDPATNAWSLGGAGPGHAVSLGGVRAASLADGIHLLSDGYHDVYDPASDTWSSRAAPPAGIAGATMEAINGVLYLTYAGTTGATWQYDAESNTWNQRKTMPSIGQNGSEVFPNKWVASTVRGSFMYVAAGSYPQTGESAPLLRYDPAVDEWLLLPEQPLNRWSFTGGGVGDRFCVVGGGAYTRRTTHPFVETYCYDRGTDAWNLAAPLPVSLSEHTMGMAAIEYGNDLYVFGGSHTPYAGDVVASAKAARLSLR